MANWLQPNMKKITIPDSLITGKLQSNSIYGYKRCAIGVLLYHAGVDPKDLAIRCTPYGKFKCKGFEKEITGLQILKETYGLTIEEIQTIQDDNDTTPEEDRVTIFIYNLVIHSIPYEYKYY